MNAHQSENNSNKKPVTLQSDYYVSGTDLSVLYTLTDFLKKTLGYGSICIHFLCIKKLKQRLIN